MNPITFESDPLGFAVAHLPQDLVQALNSKDRIFNLPQDTSFHHWRLNLQPWHVFNTLGFWCEQFNRASDRDLMTSMLDVLVRGEMERPKGFSERSLVRLKLMWPTRLKVHEYAGPRRSPITYYISLGVNTPSLSIHEYSYLDNRILTLLRRIHIDRVRSEVQGWSLEEIRNFLYHLEAIEDPIGREYVRSWVKQESRRIAREEGGE